MKKILLWILPLLVVVLALSWFFYFRHLPVFQKKTPQTIETPDNNGNQSATQEEAKRISEALTGKEDGTISFKIKDIVFSLADILQEEKRLKSPDFEVSMSKIPEKDQKVYRSQLRVDAITNLLNRIYIDLYIKENNIVITEKQVEQTMKEFEDMMRQNSQDPAKFNLEEYLSTLNVTLGDYKRDMTNQTKFTIVTNPLVENLPVANEEEIKAYWESHKEMFNDPPAADIDVLLTDAEEKVDQAIAFLQGGGNWAEACTKFSNLPAEQTKLGLMPKTDMPEELANVIFSPNAKINSYNKVQFMTQWYVVKINSFRQGLERSYEEARADADKAFMNEKKRGIVEAFLKDLSEKYGKPVTVQ
ncbi:MAG: peptidylprolyl isomerase [Caldisericia bacterium]|nr:peptidylprolyl isomerase [Caldisericia bacterium]